MFAIARPEEPSSCSEIAIFEGSSFIVLLGGIVEVDLTVPAGTDMDVIREQYPDLCEDEGWEDEGILPQVGL